MAADHRSPPGVLDSGRAILHNEARALDALAHGLGDRFEQVVAVGTSNQPVGVLPIYDCPVAR